MAPPKLEIAPELLAEAQRLYEKTGTPAHEIAALMGVSRGTLRNRIREWGWTRRRHPSRELDLLHAVRGAAIATVTAPDAPQEAVLPVTPERRAALAARVMTVAERSMDAIERVLATVNPKDQGEGERGTRMLASLTQTLREIDALNKADEATPPEAAETDPDALPRDIDEFREALARRIEAFVAARRGGAEPIAIGTAGAGDQAERA